MRNCIIPGCDRVAAGYSTLCTNHAKTKARHGHPLQTSVQRKELKPYEKAAKKWLDSRSSSKAWGILTDLWNIMVTNAGIYAERGPRGRPYQRHVLQACDIILTIDKSERRGDAILRMLAMGYLQHAYPKRFRSDEAFQFEAARQLRSLTDASVGIYWDHKTGKSKKVYRDVSPRVLRALWAQLTATHLTAYGREIGEADLKERGRRKYKRQDVSRALLGNTAYDGKHSGGAEVSQ